MEPLASAERLVASPPTKGRFVPVRLSRRDEGGLVFVSCKELPELFIAVRAEDEVRPALDNSLKNAFSKVGRIVLVYTNGKIDGPTIDAAVRIIDTP